MSPRCGLGAAPPYVGGGGGVRCSFRVSTRCMLRGEEKTLAETLRWDTAEVLGVSVGSVDIRGLEQGRGYVDVTVRVRGESDGFAPDELDRRCQELIPGCTLPWASRYLSSTPDDMAVRILVCEMFTPPSHASRVSIVRRGADMVLESSGPPPSAAASGGGGGGGAVFAHRQMQQAYQKAYHAPPPRVLTKQF